jgi:proteasome lid subunit RPN8/RPN11
LATESSQKPIVIPVWLWRRVILQLRRRGGGHSESGAFLLAEQAAATDRVKSFVCYDDLDPNAYDGGVIAFHAVGYSALWEQCRNSKRRVVADVHTHPGRYVRQSSIDQRNPMLPLQGHTALIVPNFGDTPWWTLDGIGVYEHLGGFRWRSHPVGSRKRSVILSLW